jgi:anti-sigma regulatory factor (Ser/Thr protein kinase)
VSATRSVNTAVTVALPFSASAVRAARSRLAETLLGAQVPQPQIDDARIVLSELMSNAIMHARPLPSAGLEVSWQVDAQAITVSVTDGGGPTLPASSEAALLALGGRGLAIVQALSADWGVEGDESTTTVHASIAL